MEITSVEEYRELTRKLPDDWQDDEASAVLEYWLYAVRSYLKSDCDEKVLVEICGSLGEFGHGAECLIDWVVSQEENPQTLWDACMAIEYQLDGEGMGSKGISRLFDRAGPLFMMFDYGVLCAPFLTLDAKPAASNSSDWWPAEVASKLKVDNKTVNKYAKAAQIATPGKGKRNFRYPKDDVAAICEQFISTSPDNETVELAKSFLEEIETK